MRLTVLLAGACALAGCAADPGSEAGFGLPTFDPDPGVATTPIEGSLVVEANGCFTLDSDGFGDGGWIVWPATARQDGADVVLDSGARLGDGDTLVGEGAVLALADLPAGGNPDSFFGSFGGFCDAGERGVVVLVEVTTG